MSPGSVADLTRLDAFARADNVNETDAEPGDQHLETGPPLAPL